MANEHKWYYEKQGELIGPIDAASMSEMISSGQLTGETPVWRDGLIGRQPIAGVPELAGYLPDPSAPTSQAGVQPVAATHVRSSAPTSGLAVASLVLGIISLALFCLVPISLPCGIIGLILGLSANKGPSKQPLATAGIVTSIIGSLISVLLVVGSMQQDNQPDRNEELNKVIEELKKVIEEFEEKMEAIGEGIEEGEGEGEAGKDDDLEEAVEELRKRLEKVFGEGVEEAREDGDGEGEDPEAPFDVEPESPWA